jgi:hypothetical protein
MRVELDYRGFRIEVTAIQDGRAWNAAVRIQRILSSSNPHVEVVPYRLPTADDAERRGGIYARRWVARHGLGSA